MITLPLSLVATSTLKVRLPSDELATLPMAQPSIPAWSGAPVPFQFGRKPVVQFDQQPLFAELWILRTLEQAGWSGVWVSSYGGVKFFRDMPTKGLGNHVALPSDKAELLSAISERCGGRGGCFDVFAWRGNDTLFCEAKRKDKDAIRVTQARWIAAALAHGIPASSLLIVEWSNP